MLAGKHLTRLHRGRIYEACIILLAGPFWKAWSSFFGVLNWPVVRHCLLAYWGISVAMVSGRDSHDHTGSADWYKRKEGQQVAAKTRMFCYIVEVSLALLSDCLLPGEVTLIQTACLIFKYKNAVRPSLKREFQRRFLWENKRYWVLHKWKYTFVALFHWRCWKLSLWSDGLNTLSI